MSIKIRIQERLNRSRRYVFIRADFGDIAGYDQVGRVLRELVKDGELIKVGYGVYTKSRKNSMTGRLMPACPGGSDAVILEALGRLGIGYSLGRGSMKYLSGESTQIPAYTQIETPCRFKRRLSVGNSRLNA